ncbi:MAG: DUF3656 domain-containing protein, partial [Verrucomicrobia bacterium]|nr:DUF3656 domain-containing protein [Verrucomicrobiota bacterium]
KPGMRLFKTGDQALEQRLRQTFAGEIPLRRKAKLDLTITGEVGEPLVIFVSGTEIKVESSLMLDAARQRPLNEEVLRAQLGRLGGTPYELGTLDCQLIGEVILPVSELNRMRRSLVDAMGQRVEVSESVKQRPVPAYASVTEMLAKVAADVPVAPVSPTLHVLCRSNDQIDAALSCGVSRLYVDFEDIRLYADTVKRVKDHGAAQIYLATPRIQKSGEAGFFKLISRAEPHGVLIRNLGAISFFKDEGIPVTGDFSLNVSNPLTAEFLKQTGLERLTISYDLNVDQVLNLLQGAPPEWFEITLHQHMPMFHMEHCAFAAFLSTGTDFTNCGRPCEKHKVTLRDRVGMEHPLKADVGCRNTLFNAVPQTGAQYFSGLMQTGLRHYRVELLEQNREEAARVIRTYQDLLAGQRGGEDIWRDLKAQSQLGVTRGTMADMIS